MKKLIDTTDDATWDAPEHRQRLAYHILIELLAYQFASYVSVLLCLSHSPPALDIDSLPPSRSFAGPSAGSRRRTSSSTTTSLSA
jgi:hypothetical protein